MEHQNWETYILKGNDFKKKQKEPLLNDKNKPKINHQSIKDNKLEKKVEEGDMKHKKINPELSKKIQQMRLSKGLTQKQLANQLSLPQQTINEIETGKYIYNHQVINKVKRKLNIK
jgi:ribosome-binding protein aMBF1 (putative translation factor)|tara:strand:- start:247 stop:594 length:348 start_codon:yes stop_codon:yes gene_type:complete